MEKLLVERGGQFMVDSTIISVFPHKMFVPVDAFVFPFCSSLPAVSAVLGKLCPGQFAQNGTHTLTYAQCFL